MARRRNRPETSRDGEAAATGPDLPAIYRRIVENNRFMPIPKAEQRFVGDGDFRAIGAEFLELFIRHGGLRPDCDVLDVGCGIGRMALPLTQYLAPDANYVGVDVNRRGLAWCRRHITRHYRNFRFRHVDYNNALYNPAGRTTPWETPLPFSPGSFDFIIATSLFTHLSRQELKTFAKQFEMLLRPGGRLFATFFLLDAAAEEAMTSGGTARLAFPAGGGRFDVQALGLPAFSAVAFQRDYVEQLLEAAGFVFRQPPIRGSWSGISGGVTYQDVVVVERPSSGAEG